MLRICQNNWDIVDVLDNLEGSKQVIIHTYNINSLGV